MQMPELDDLDLSILTLIKHNARMSYSEIGNRVGLSRVSVKNRMKSMEERGVIVAYEAHTMRPKKPEEIMFFLDITTTMDAFGQILEQLKGMDTLRQIYTTTGECRIHCIGVAPNSNKMQNFVNNLYRNTEGMKRLECHAVLATVKDLDGGVDENDRERCIAQESDGGSGKP